MRDRDKLKLGKVADGVLLDGDPFETTTHVTHVLLGGSLVLRSRLGVEEPPPQLRLEWFRHGLLPRTLSSSGLEPTYSIDSDRQPTRSHPSQGRLPMRTASCGREVVESSGSRVTSSD